MSPIFIRPAREQYEHDRLIRFLESKYKRKFSVAINPGEEHAAPVKLGANTFYPDLVLTTGKKLAGLVEVETGESVNNLEAMAQWVHFSRSRVPFHLYVPVPSYDSARRLCEANQARVSEIWTYRPALDGFDLVRMHHDASAATARPPANPSKGQTPKKAAKPSKAAARPAASSKSPKASRNRPVARQAAGKKKPTAPPRTQKKAAPRKKR